MTIQLSKNAMSDPDVFSAIEVGKLLQETEKQTLERLIETLVLKIKYYQDIEKRRMVNGYL